MNEAEANAEAETAGLGHQDVNLRQCWREGRKDGYMEARTMSSQERDRDEKIGLREAGRVIKR